MSRRFVSPGAAQPIKHQVQGPHEFGDFATAEVCEERLREIAVISLHTHRKGSALRRQADERCAPVGGVWSSTNESVGLEGVNEPSNVTRRNVQLPAALALGEVNAREVRVVLPGGTLLVRPGPNFYELAGPAEYVFSGELASPRGPTNSEHLRAVERS